MALPGESAPEHWLRNLRLSGFTVLMLLLVVLATIVLAPNLRILIEQRQTIAELETTVTETEATVSELEDDVARWNDRSYIESQARERLLFVYPGESSYLVIDDGTGEATDGGVPISTDIQPTQVDWVSSILSSVFTAGLTEAPVAEIPVAPVEGTP